jgi:diguanylate cyclase (GGDEF)-like protein
VLSETVAMEKTAKDHFAEESVTDALTGLRNYSFFKKNADFLFNISIRYDSPFTLVIMDIDHFKHINDTYGHKTGNLVLEHFSKALKSCFRRADILIRYGGDEFMLLLPGINANRINYVMKRLERHIRENPLQLGNTRISYTFKWGASEFKEDIPDINEMFKEADKKLYSSKNRD